MIYLMFESSPRATISQSLGWLYFIAWTVSFYPQVFLNVRRKSVEGLSIDFVSLNVVGFTSYTIYTTNFFFNEEVREEYRKRHNGYDNSVQLNDVAFAIHLYVSIAKYIPQAFSNFNRKSTEGWSIANVLLDFTGGLLSLLQLLIDSFALDDWSSITGNPVKFGLSMLSLSFGLLFISQHYILYATKRSTSHDDSPHDTEVAAGESRPLLG
ncbi:unnamed protein product [Rhizoctonia solani]|uniref:Cystinosin n=1 Tax=Rhizoctonia solani TaxID=456999 RepID=A0A8H3CY27_9AGAM|nr:unnamed protein product [Rhizoctonia solani]